jgi:hypothetical protein
MNRPLLTVICLASAVAVPEPKPRLLKPVPLEISAPLQYVSAARELPDGRIIVTNARQSTVLILDPRTGTATPIGQAGGGPDRYAKPGGLYAGPDGATLLFDRGQTRVFTISPRGELQGSRSVARRGVRTSADDFDLQRVDAAGRVYFSERSGGSLADSKHEAVLMRLDAESQTLDELATLRLPDGKTIAGGDGMTFWRGFIGSPADGWGVAPDGRVAVVRADPYRVEWISRDGKITRGPVIDITPLPMTEADKRHHTERARQRGGVSIGMTGGGKTDMADLGLLFAETKAPFNPQEVLVSPDGRVWVLRTQPLEVADIVYDVFDGAGRRVDRVQLPADSRIVGFGARAVLVRTDANGRFELRKFAL